MVALVKEMYHLLLSDLENNVLDFDWVNGDHNKIVLFGGIHINLDDHLEDMFLPIIFDLRSRNGDKQSIFEECFPKKEKIIPKHPQNLKLTTIQAFSAGFEGGNFAKITLNGIPIDIEPNKFRHWRGINLVVINPKTGKIETA